MTAKFNKPEPCLAYDQKSGALTAYNQLPDGGAIGGLSHGLAMMYNTAPLSAPQYLADVGSNLGLVSPAYAESPDQSAGGSVIKPVLQVWQLTRNIAYLVFIIVFVVVGFMIMLRQKINAQTVVNIQNALPGLVMGLILVTFSYFIAALIVDFAFLGTQLVALVFTQAGSNIISDPAGVAKSGNMLSLFKEVVFNGDTLGLIVTPVQQTFSQLFGTIQLGGVIGFLGGLLGIVALLVIVIAIAVQMFKLLWQLIQAYITILIVTVLGPFIILGASIPGRGAALGGWWRPILANTLIFPVVYAAFLFAGMFLKNAQPITTVPPLFAGFPLGVVSAALGYGIILATPGIPKMVKEALKAPDNPLGAVATQGFQSGGRALRGAWNTGTADIQAERGAYAAAAQRRRIHAFETGPQQPFYRRSPVTWLVRPSGGGGGGH